MTTKEEGTPTAEEIAAKEAAEKAAAEEAAKKAEADRVAKAEAKAEDQRKRAEKAEAAAAALKKQLEEGGGSDADFSDADLEKFAEDNGVTPEFVKGLLGITRKLLKKETGEAVRSELAPRDEEQKKKEAMAEFKKALDKVKSSDRFKSVEVSEEAVFAVLAANPDRTVEDVVESIYGANIPVTTRGSSENGSRPGASRAGDVVDFANPSPEQLEAIMADPEARQKYFDWRDAQGK